MAKSLLTKKGNGLLGADEIAAKLKKMVDGLQGREKSMLAREVLGDLGKAAWTEVGSVAKSTAESKGLSKEISDAIFVDSGMGGIESRQRLSALIGINKQKSMRTWTASWSSQMNAKAKVSAGGKVAMSLATMEEFGTSRQKPRPFLRPAIDSGRRSIPGTLGKLLWDTIKKWNGNNPQ